MNKSKSRITLFSTINSFQTIPPAKQFVGFFRQFGEIIAIENKIVGYEDFFVSSRNNNTLILFESIKNFNGQTLQNKIWKYIYNFQKMIMVRWKFGSEIIFYCNDIVVLFFAIILRSKKSTIVYHQIEMIETNRLNVLDRFVFNLISYLSSSVNVIITPEINRSNYLAALLRINDHTKVLTIPNSNNNFHEIKSRGLVKKKVIVTHIGHVGLDHNIEIYLQAISKLDESKYEFRFIGLLKDDVVKLLEGYKKSNLYYIGQVMHKDLHQYYMESDIGVILYKDVSLNHRFCAPNKLYEYWSYGIPVLGDKLPGLEGVFTESFLGELVDMQKAEVISEALLRLSKVSDKDAIANYFQTHLKLDNYLNQLKLKLTST